VQQDGVAEAKESTSAERVSTTWTIDAGRAHLAAWSFLALINIVHGPGIVRRRVATPVTLMDLGPTILDLFGLQTPGSYMGQSIAPLLVSEDAELTRPLIADARREIQAFYFPDGKKVIFTRRKKTVEVYDLESDPEELNNLIETGAQAVDRHVPTAEYFFSSVRRKE
jgi:arylsulfatase A-like enzyme